MTFFVDNNLSVQLARGMAGFGEDVTHLKDHYPPDAADADWLPQIGRDAWVLLTRDDRVRFNPAELAASAFRHRGQRSIEFRSRRGMDQLLRRLRNLRNRTSGTPGTSGTSGTD